MTEAARIVGAAAALGLALAIVAPRATARAVGLVLCTAGCVALALVLAPAGHAGLYAAVGGVGLAVAAVLAALFLRVPWMLAIVALACVPVGLDVHVGAAHGRLPVPLYAVAAAAAFALVWRPRHGRDLGVVAWPLALLVALLGASLLWSDDPRAGARMLVLFVLPLGVLALALARLQWRPGWSAALALELGALGVGLAVVGGVRYLGRDLTVPFGAPVVSDWYYRVGPAFAGPGAYARFLVVAIAATAAIAVRVRDARVRLCAAAAACLMWLGLLCAFSEPALVALAAALVVVIVAVWTSRAVFPAALLVTLGAAAAGSLATVRGEVLRVPGGGAGSSVYSAIRVALDHPVAGVGVGAHAAPDAVATVAAELGAPGLLALAAVVVAALAALRGARTAGGLALTAALVAIAVDAAFRGALLTDPLFWGVLGLAGAAARRAPEPPAGRRGDQPTIARWPVTSPRRSSSASWSRRGSRSSTRSS